MGAIQIICPQCGRSALKPASAVNRARTAGLNVYCSRACSGVGRRKGKTRAELKAAKRLYDLAYRKANLKRIKASKAAYFKATYDPDAARIERRKRAKEHAEYCRQPEYKKWKSEYDRRRRAGEYGPFSEAYMIALELNRMIKQRATCHKISTQNNTVNKRQNRRLQSSEAISRNHSRSVDG